MRLIDANALSRVVNADINRCYQLGIGSVGPLSLFLDQINEQPTINPDDLRPQGRWVFEYWDSEYINKHYSCSECGFKSCVKESCCPTKYCPNCGAKMDGKENENDRHRSNRHRRGGYPDSGNHLLSGGSCRGREDGQEMSELKACPFCGSDAVVHVENGVRVICEKCGASTKTLVDTYTQGRPTGGAIKTVVNAWNRRANRDE